MDSLVKLLDVDLNLLKIFVALDDARNVTKAAKRMSLSQPAISHALARLRVTFNDPLFVKTSSAMVPTPHAQKVAASIRRALDAIERSVCDAKEFVPAELERTFRIRTTDLFEGMVLPELIRILESEAPGVNVSFTTTCFSLPKAELEAGDCDLAIAGFFGELPDGFYQQKLIADHFLCVARKGHPRLGKRKRISLEEFCAERHALIAPGGDLTSSIEKALQGKKLQRKVAVGLSGFAVAGQVIANSDLLLTAPSLLISQMEQMFPIVTFTPPLAVPGFSIIQTWHERNHQDPGHRWFRDALKRCVPKPTKSLDSAQ